MTEAQEIAARLSEAQVNLLFFWPKGLFNATTARSLTRKGLIRGRTVTPLGEQVKRLLEEEQQHGR